MVVMNVSLFAKLHVVQNAAAHLVCNLLSHSPNEPMLRSLLWLPIKKVCPL